MFLMLDKRAKIVGTAEPPKFLVVISPITGQYRDRLYVPSHFLWCNLRIVLWSHESQE